MPDVLVFLDLGLFAAKLLENDLHGAATKSGGQFRLFVEASDPSDTDKIKDIGGYDLDRDMIGRETVVLAARRLEAREMAFVSGARVRRIGLEQGREGHGLLHQLARLGFRPSGELRDAVAQADALAAARIGGLSIEAAVDLFGREHAVLSTPNRQTPADTAPRLELPKLRPDASRFSRRVNPGGLNQGLLVHKEDGRSPVAHAQLSHVVTHPDVRRTEPDRSLDTKAICDHLRIASRPDARFGDIPARGWVLGSKASGNNLSLALTLPRQETAFADVFEQRVETLHKGQVRRHYHADRLTLTAKALGDETDRRAIENLVRAHAPVAARPVRAARLNLFIPFRFDGSARGLVAAATEISPAEASTGSNKNYFLPHLKPLFGLEAAAENAPSLRSVTSPYWNKHRLGGLLVDHPSYAEPLIRDLGNLQVHWLADNAALLEVEIDMAPESETEPASFAEHLDFTAFARRIRHQYGGKAPGPDGREEPVRWGLTLDFDDIGPHDLPPDMLDRLGELAELRQSDLFEIIGNDRAFVFQSTLLDGTPPEPGTGAAADLGVALERYNMVDGWGDAPFYAADFSRDEFTASSYARFADTGSHYMATDHSFVFLGFAGRWAGELDAQGNGPEPSFAETRIHPEHMPHIYRRMVIYALLVRAELDLFEKRLGDLSAVDNLPFDVIRDLQQDYARFVHGTWRETVSGQVQGQELFALITRRFAIKERVAKLSADFDALDRVAAQRQRAAREVREAGAETQRIMFTLMAGVATAVLTFFQVLGNDRATYFPLTLWKAVLAEEPGLGGALWNLAVLVLAIATFILAAFSLSKAGAWAVRTYGDRIVRRGKVRIAKLDAKRRGGSRRT